jgi:hypothetical protein
MSGQNADEAKPPNPGARRSGSQRRRVTARIAVNCTPAQKAAIHEKSDATGLSPSALCLAVLLDAPLPARRRNPTVNQQAMTRYFGNTAKLSDALRDVLAELGKSGSNVNQIAYMLNAGTAPARIAGIIESAIQEHRTLVEACMAAVEDLKELRIMGMEALGRERPGKES